MPKFIVTTVTYEDGCVEDTAVFVKVYSTVSRCVQEIEKHAEEAFKRLVDPNDGDTHVWPGVETVMKDRVFQHHRNDSVFDYTEYTIVEVTVES